MAGRDVEELLEPGEGIEESVTVGDNRVVVTNRRVLAFTPGGSGKRYHTVDRPNVTGVGVYVRSRRLHLVNAAGAFLVAALLIGAGRFIETDNVFEGIATGPGASAIGVGGIISEINYWVGLIDDALLYGGLAVLLLVAFYAALYVRSRRKVIALSVAGDDDVDLPAGDVTEPGDRVDELRFALDLAVEGEEGDAVEKEPVWE